MLVRYIRSVNALLQGWAALIALGIAPTLITVVGAVVGLLGGFLLPALAFALICSLVVNLYVAANALRTRLRQRRFEREWAREAAELEARREAEPGPPRPDWLPDENGSPTASNADLDGALEIAIREARAAIGPDATVRATLIGLDDKTIIFDARSRVDHKACSVHVRGNGSAFAYSKSRWEPVDRPAIDTGPPLWRLDASWVNLLTESWRIERPFEGDVYLWPLSEYEKVPGAGAWRLCYIPEVEGFRGQERCYILIDGALSRHPVRKPNEPTRPLTASAGSTPAEQGASH